MWVGDDLTKICKKKIKKIQNLLVVQILPFWPHPPVRVTKHGMMYKRRFPFFQILLNPHILYQFQNEIPWQVCVLVFNCLCVIEKKKVSKIITVVTLTQSKKRVRERKRRDDRIFCRHGYRQPISLLICECHAVGGSIECSQWDKSWSSSRLYMSVFVLSGSMRVPLNCLTSVRWVLLLS